MESPPRTAELDASRSRSGVGGVLSSCGRRLSSSDSRKATLSAPVARQHMEKNVYMRKSPLPTEAARRAGMAELDGNLPGARVL